MQKDLSLRLLNIEGGVEVIKEPELKELFSGCSSYSDRIRVISSVKDSLSILGLKMTFQKTSTGIRFAVFDGVDGGFEAPKLKGLAKAKHDLLECVIIGLFMGCDPLVSSSAITEDALWAFLETFGIHKNREHKIFGDVKKLISASFTAEFIKNGWVRFERRKDASKVDGTVETVFFSWGPTAHAVVNPMEVLKFFCSLHGSEPTSWKSHYAYANKILQQCGETV
ncbi:hypothetical protein AB6A40_009142 [Gnathostoma spinigerum]|uniref:MAGE domain-containing protein n=1 Tax=Gnathostoma spinigerum TaxID=75299 RepID=A0ABD6ER57_9BILA